MRQIYHSLLYYVIFVSEHYIVPPKALLMALHLHNRG